MQEVQLPLYSPQEELEWKVRYLYGLAISKQVLRVALSNDDVSDPPTDAQLDSAFGTPSMIGNGFVGVLDDAGAGTKVWLCVAKNSRWWYEELTAAV